MNIKSFIYNYRNAKLGDCMLFRREIIDAGKTTFHSTIMPKLDENKIVDMSKFLKRHGADSQLNYWGYSEYWTMSDNIVWLNEVETYAQRNGFGTDLLRDISMVVNGTGHTYLKLLTTPGAHAFYEKLGFAEIDYHGFSIEMLSEIKSSKFADFSKFKLNKGLSDICTEVLQ